MSTFFNAPPRAVKNDILAMTFHQTFSEAEKAATSRFPEQAVQITSFFRFIHNIFHAVISTAQSFPEGMAFLKSETHQSYSIRSIPNQQDLCFCIFLKTLRKGAQAAIKPCIRITETEYHLVAIKRQLVRNTYGISLDHESAIVSELLQKDVKGIVPMKSFEYLGKQGQRRIAYEMPFFKEDLHDFIERTADKTEPKIRSLKETIALQLLSTIDQIHIATVVHYDCKPENILLDEHGIPFIGDFGIAKHNNEPLAARGSPGHIAPEIFKNFSHKPTPSYPPLIDLWALGSTLYTLFIAEKPFADLHIKMMEKILKKEPIEQELSQLEEIIRKSQGRIQTIGLGKLGETISRLLDADPQKRTLS